VRTDGDATIPVALNESCLLQIGQQHFTDPSWHAGAALCLEMFVDFKVGGVERANTWSGLRPR
jgi:hypothetical protein